MLLVLSEGLRDERGTVGTNSQTSGLYLSQVQVDHEKDGTK